MNPKTERAVEPVDAFNEVVPDVIEAMMREAGVLQGGMAGTAAGIRAQVNSYLASFAEGGRAMTPRQVETARVLMMALVAAAPLPLCRNTLQRKMGCGSRVVESGAAE